VSSTRKNRAGVADAGTDTPNRGFARRGITRAGMFTAAAVAVVGVAGVASAAAPTFLGSVSKHPTVAPTAPATRAATTGPRGAGPAGAVTGAPAATAPTASAAAAAAPTDQAPAVALQNGSTAGNQAQGRTEHAPPVQIIQGPAPEPDQDGSGQAPQPAAPAAAADPGADSGFSVDWDAINKGLRDYQQQQLQKAIDDANNGPYDPMQHCTNCGG
jgi:hypothetical protein